MKRCFPFPLPVWWQSESDPALQGGQEGEPNDELNQGKDVSYSTHTKQGMFPKRYPTLALSPSTSLRSSIKPFSSAVCRNVLRRPQDGTNQTAPKRPEQHSV
ncbi:unnamed protein product [Arctogadus glacialis]